MADNYLKIQTGDHITLKKTHPCGSSEWIVYRIGADIGLQCCGCAHRILVDREKLEKRVVIRKEEKPENERK
jgi:hypothetical protein